MTTDVSTPAAPEIEVENQEQTETPEQEEKESNEDEANPETETPESDPEPKDPADLSIDDLPLPGDEVEDEKKGEKLPKWAELRLAKKDREIEQARAEAEAIKQAVLQQQQQMQQQPNQNPYAAPERADFETDGEYMEAMVHFSNQKMLARTNQEIERRAHEKAHNEFVTKWNNSKEEGEKEYPGTGFSEGFDIMNSKGFPPNPMMAHAIVESPFKIGILAFLAQNIEHAKKIALKSPIEAAKEIGKIEQRFAERKKKVATKAPALIPPVKPKGSPAAEDPEKMSPEEFRVWYDAKKRNK